LKLRPAAILNQNPIFEMGSNSVDTQIFFIIGFTSREYLLVPGSCMEIDLKNKKTLQAIMA
jgi:hypothetical protein